MAHAIQNVRPLIGAKASGEVPLTANVYKKVLNGSMRDILHLQALGGDVNVFFDDDPFCLTFDGGDHVAANTVATDANLIASTKGIIQAKIILDAVGTTARTVFSVSASATNEYIRLYVDASGYLVAELVKAAGTVWSVTTDTPLAALTYYKVAVGHDGTVPYLTIDGDKWPQTITGTTVNKAKWFSALAAMNRCRIGSLNTNGAGEADWFVGDISWVVVSRRYTNTGSPSTNVSQEIVARVANWEISEGAGTSLTDASGNSHTGTFGATTAAPTWATDCGWMVIGANNQEKWYGSVPVTGVWALTAASSVTMAGYEGYEYRAYDK